MSQLTDSMYQDRRAVIRDVTQAQFDAQRGNYKPDVIYRVDGVAMYMPVRNGHYQSSMPRLTFAELSAAYPPSESLAGMHAWCTDYPSVGGYGAEVICTGTRWKSISQQHCLLSPPSASAGTLFAVGAAEVVYGSVVLIPAGVLAVDDNIRMMAIFTHPTIGTAARTVSLRIASTEAGILSGSNTLRFGHASGANNYVTVDKLSTIVSETEQRASNSATWAAISTTSAHATGTMPNVSSSNIYAALTVAPSADTSILMFAASVYVEFAR